MTVRANGQGMIAALPPPPDSLLDHAALFLDFDGTLVELAETPDAIQVSPALAPMLARLRARLEGRLAIISGRSIDDLKRHLPLHDIAFSGSHGLELQLAGGAGLPLSVPVGLDHAHAAVRHFAEGIDGLIVEEKPAGIALHYRLAPQHETAALRLMAELAAANGFRLQRGKMVVELRPEGADKGDALNAFMTEPEFRDAVPVFVGDDLTDEHAFSAAAALGGAGVLVGPPRETVAAYRLDSVAAVAEWLAR